MRFSRLLPAEAGALAPRAVLPPWVLENETTSNGTAMRSNNGFSRSNTAVIAAADYPKIALDRCDGEDGVIIRFFFLVEEAGLFKNI